MGAFLYWAATEAGSVSYPRTVPNMPCSLPPAPVLDTGSLYVLCLYAKWSEQFVTYSFLNSCDFVEIFFFYIQISSQNIKIILKQMYTLLYYHIFVDIL